MSRTCRRRPSTAALVELVAGGGLAFVALLALLVAVAVPSAVAAPAGPGAGSEEALDLILTEVPAAPAPCDGGSRVVRLGADGSRHVLSGELTACDPVLDPSGRWLLFRGRSGEEGGGQAWRIWRLGLSATGDTEGVPEAITSGERSCRSPFFFPDGGVGFLCDGDLFRTPAGADPGAGAEPVRLTSSGGAFRSAGLLPDGRLLLESRTAAGEPILVTAQPDGTWARRWRDAPFPGLSGVRPVAPDGLLVTLEGGLFLASLSDPFAPPRPLATLDGGEVRDPAALPGGGALVSFRGQAAEPFRVGRVVAGGSGGVEELASASRDGEGHALQPLALAPRTPDTPLPGIVKPELNTGYLVLFDAARSDHPALSGLERADVAAVRIFPWSDGPRGDTAVDLPPAEDGSVFLEVPSDRPYGMALVGADGEPVGPAGGPFWVRPNERRACMGCHVSTRYAPPNVRPRAMTAAPRWVGWGAERHGPRSEFEEGSH